MAGEQTSFNVDMQIIRDYVTLRDQTLNSVVNQFNAGLNDFETTIRSSSPVEAAPNILGALAKSAAKLIEKQVASAVKAATNDSVDIAPLIELVHGINDEIERARTAATSLEVGNWIAGLRSSVNNVLTNQVTLEALTQQYSQSDEDERSNLVADIGEQLDALTPAAKELQAIKNQIFECGLYEDWINAHFANDCVDGPGNIHIDLNDDGEIRSVTINAPLGDRIEGAFNSRLLAKGFVPGLNRVADIKAGKKVSIGDHSGCFDDRNQLSKGSDVLSDNQLQDGLNRATVFVRP